MLLVVQGLSLAIFLIIDLLGLMFPRSKFHCKKKYPEFKNQFYQKDVNKEIDDLNKYDVITLLEFIEHISPKEVDDLINKLMKKLTKNGRIIITTPNYKGLWLSIEKCISTCWES